MIAKTKAIVLKNTNYSENSVISKMYTREFGLRTYIFQSIRKGKSPIRLSMIQPISILQMDVYENSSRNIQRVKELKNEPMLLSIQDSMIKKSVAIFITEVMNLCITDEQCEVELFDFLEQSILKLEQEETLGTFPIEFLLRLGYHLGVQPQGEYSNETPYFSIDEGVFVSETRLHTVDQFMSSILSTLVKNEKAVDVSKSQRKQLLLVLIKYYQFHIIKDKRIKSVEILSELFG